MKVFICYRHSDNEFLAEKLHATLLSCDPTMTIFLDVVSIRPSKNYPDMILRQIESSNILIALIGPGWNSTRLADPQDHVRSELLAAQERGKRVIPVLHNGQREPTVVDLPTELSWLPHANMFSVNGVLQFRSDVERLYNALTNRMPELAQLRERAWSLYERHEDDELRRTVEEAQHEHAVTPSPALADCCRTLAIALTRRSDDSGLRNLWLVRALSTAYLSETSNSFAASLLPFFFRLMEDGEPAAAREVMNEIGRLGANDDPGQLPPTPILRRIYHKKVGYSLFVEGLFDQALEEYSTALIHADIGHDIRKMYKIRDAMAVCDFALERHAEAIALTEQVMADAGQDSYVDVFRTAKHNLQAMQHNDVEFKPYEVLQLTDPYTNRPQTARVLHA